MRPPIYVRPVTDAEQQTLTASLRATEACTVRRSQMLLASARGATAPEIARSLSCNEQTVRNAIHAFNRDGLAALYPGSSRPHTTQAAFDARAAERLRALLHRSPRDFGHPTSLWTLELAAAEAYRQGLTERPVTGETVRVTLARLGVHWLRAKHWITSPDPAYARKKGSATA
jgi:transposase